MEVSITAVTETGIESNENRGATKKGTTGKIDVKMLLRLDKIMELRDGHVPTSHHNLTAMKSPVFKMMS